VSSGAAQGSDLGMWDSDPALMSKNWDCCDLRIVTRFFDSIDGLQEVVVMNLEGKLFNQIKNGLLQR
jgi:hypothetical protein